MFIRTQRHRRQMTIDQLAAASELPYSQIARIERGKISTSVYTLYRLALALGISFRDMDWEKISSKTGD
ncbi:MAG: helix-turn-helix transcriptional regulator [Cyclobacteriaceae bacterium]